MCLSLSLNRASSETASSEAAEYCSPAHKDENTATLTLLYLHIECLHCRITSICSMMSIAQILDKTNKYHSECIYRHKTVFTKNQCAKTVSNSLAEEA